MIWEETRQLAMGWMDDDDDDEGGGGGIGKKFS